MSLSRPCLTKYSTITGLGLVLLISACSLNPNAVPGPDTDLNQPVITSAQQDLNFASPTPESSASNQQSLQGPMDQTSPLTIPQPTPLPTAATIQTTRGTITIKLFSEATPLTVKNFASKAQADYYNNLTFHRVEDWVVQGGDPKGNGTGGGIILTELTPEKFVRGSVGVARGGDISKSNDSQFFITKSDSPHLDQQYTNFGVVTAGMEIVDALQIGDKILSIVIN